MASYPALDQDLSCDVVIVGGGITGALVGYHLVEEGVDTVVIDKRDVVSGSTAASTSLLQYEIDTELVDLISRVGESHAVRAYRLGLNAIDAIERLLGPLGDDCGFERKKSLYFASRKTHVANLYKEFECRVRHGFEVEFLDQKAILAHFPFAAPAAIYSSGDAMIDAYRFTHRLLAHAGRNGLRIYDRTQLTATKLSRNRVNLKTDRGHSIAARRVVFATGYESGKFLRRDPGRLRSTFAAISEPMAPFPQWCDHCLIWETARPYFYLRPTHDHRILIGGEDSNHATDHKRDGLIERKTTKLVRRFESLFPGVEFDVAYDWAGTFGETTDGLAMIGGSPDLPRADFALGYGGNGITMSVIAAQLITDRCLGRKNPDAAIFRFDR